MELGARTLIVALIVAALAPGLSPVAAHHHAVIQPGANMVEPYGCTLNFVFEDAGGDLYIGTAGHCVDEEGQQVHVDGIADAIGEVAWRDYWDINDIDIALVDIYDAKEDLVDPSVRYWGGPTGVAAQDETGPGTSVIHYGYGIGYGASETTRPRAGALVTQDEKAYCADTPVIYGDSGSPVMTGDGQALGIVARLGVYCLPQTTLEGPTVPRIIDQAKIQKGLDLSLVTTPLEDPVDREQDRLAHLCGSCSP